MERDLLSSLTFKVQSKNLYEESMILVKLTLASFKAHKISEKVKDQLFSFMLFLCQLVVHDY